MVAIAVLVLAVGWRHTWPDLNRDFNHLHGYEHTQDALLARMFVTEGPRHLGFAPATYALHDPGQHYRYYTHYSALPHLLLAGVVAAAPARYEHLALRVAGMCVTSAFLLLLYLFGRRFGGRRFAAWLLLFGAVSAELLFFGVFPAMYVLGSLFVIAAYYCYLGWRSTARGRPLLALLWLIGGYLCWIGFYAAALPIVVDIARFDPARAERRRWRWAALFAVLPVIVFVAVQAHYRFVVPWLTGKEIWADDFRSTLAARGHYAWWRSIWFYRRLAIDSFRFTSPVGVASAGAYLLVRLRRLQTRSARPLTWRESFIVCSFAMYLFLLAFPQSTLDHESTYFQLAIPLALAATTFVVDRGRLVKGVAVATTLAVAFVATRGFMARNNTPQQEFQLGVAIRLAAPKDAFVRIPLPGNRFYPVLVYYADRSLMFDVPQRFEPVGISPRFDVVYGPSGVPEQDASIAVPGISTLLLDHDPAARPPLRRVARSWDGKSWTIDGAAVTAAYGPWNLVEFDWESARDTSEPLGVEIGEWVDGSWSPLLTLMLRNNTVDTSMAPTHKRYRDAVLIYTPQRGRIALRIFDRRTSQYRPGDAGVFEIPLNTPENLDP